MGELKADVLVLGAGMVGVGAALHLQQRGRDVILVDRHELAGEETSYGNAGIIECASVFPYMFPRNLADILRYASNRAPQVRYSLRGSAVLPAVARALLSGLAARPGAARRDGGDAADPPQLDRARGADHGGRRAASCCAGRLDQAVSFEADAGEGDRRIGAGEAIWRRSRDARCRGDRAARTKSDRRLRRRESSSTSPASCSIPAASPKPMPRCSGARAGALSPAMRGRCSRTVTDAGAWR